MQPRLKRSRALWLLLILPFAGLLVPALYARQTPDWHGVPFFYWYQFAWLPVTSLLTAIVYRQTR
jgi:hypothetical protein